MHKPAISNYSLTKSQHKRNLLGKSGKHASELNIVADVKVLHWESIISHTAGKFRVDNEQVLMNYIPHDAQSEKCDFKCCLPNQVQTSNRERGLCMRNRKCGLQRA